MKGSLIIPNSLGEITLKQYQKYLKIQKNNTDLYFLQCKMIEIFCNLDGKTVRLLKVSDADRIMTILNTMFEAKPELIRTFKLGDIEYGFIPQLDDMTLGEYIDLDTNIGDWENILIAINVLFRPISKRIGDKYLIKEYDIDTKDKLTEIPIDVVLGAVFFFTQFRDRLIENYDGLFGSTQEGQFDAQTNFSRKWGWYQSLLSGLAQGDITRLEHITKLNVHNCLYALEYMKEKADLEAKKIKKNFK
tara:strand:+ start:47 stop:787 length:741 start_codon:yes stop_codon:yes gene_type:complete